MKKNTILLLTLILFAGGCISDTGGKMPEMDNIVDTLNTNGQSMIDKFGAGDDNSQNKSAVATVTFTTQYF